MKNLIPLLLAILASAMAAAAQKWQPVDIEFDSLVLNNETLTNTGIPDDAYIRRLQRMYELSADRQSDVMLWRTLYFDALADQTTDRMDDALRKGNKALEMVDSARYPYDWHRIWWLVMRAHHWNNDYGEIYKNAFKELQYYRQLSDDKMQGLMEVNIYQALKYGKMYDEAERYDSLARIHYGRIGFHNALLLREPEVMNFYMEKGDTLKARQIYRQTEQAILADPQPLRLFVLYVNAAYLGLDTLAAVKAYEIATDENNLVRPSMLSEAHLLMGDHLLEKNDPQAALKHYRWGLDNNQEQSLFSPSQIKKAAEGLSLCYKALGRSDSALKYSQIYIHLRDSLQDKANLWELNRQYVRAQIELHEQKYQSAQQMSRNRIMVLCLAITLIAIGSGAAIWYLLRRKRRQERMNRQLVSDLEHERIQGDMHRERADYNERQLAANQLRMIEKDKMIEHIKGELSGDATVVGVDPDMKRQLLNLIHMHQGSEESLAQFYEYFNQVHPTFFSTLKTRCPSLTKSNLRLCAYMRLGLDNKQIAQILGIQPEAVKMGRHRLRIKLGLESSSSLDDYILSI